MNYKRLLFTFLSAFCFGKNMWAQADIHFSQFYETSILRNPALTGVFDHDYKVTAYARTQWNSVAEPYQTLLVDAQSKAMVRQQSGDFLSFGILAYADKSGALDSKITGFYPSICYNKSVSRNNASYLSVGFTGAYLQYSFDPSRATFDYQFQGGNFNPSNPTLEAIPNAKMSLFDLGAGINFNSSPGTDNKFTYLLGLSGYHFSQPVFSYYNTNSVTKNIRWNINAALLYDITDALMLQLHSNVGGQGAYQEIIAGGLFTLRLRNASYENTKIDLSAGAMYRLNDAVIPVFKLKYQNMWLGLSYDVNTSNLKKASKRQGGPEVTAGFSGDFLKWGKGYKKTICPRF
jgi:type IX secretion system PorP/SprF family membrane protein